VTAVTDHGYLLLKYSIDVKMELDQIARGMTGPIELMSWNSVEAMIVHIPDEVT